MRSGLAVLISVALCGLLVAQDPRFARTDADLTKLSLDELIARLPDADEENVQEGAESTLAPAVREFRDRIEHGVALSAEQWKRALLQAGVLRLRERWPISIPFAVSMRSSAWLQDTHLRLTPRRRDLASVELGRSASSAAANDDLFAGVHQLYQQLGTLPLGHQQLEFDLTLERFKREQDSRGIFAARALGVPSVALEPPAGVFFAGTMAFDVDIVPALDDVVVPRSSPEIDAALRRCLSLTFVDRMSRRVPVLLQERDQIDPALARLAVSFQIDVVHDGEIVLHQDWPPSPFSCSRTWLPLDEIESGAGASERWSLRVRGSDAGVLQDWAAKSYWNGEFLVPIDELIRREQELAPNGRDNTSLAPRVR